MTDCSYCHRHQEDVDAIKAEVEARQKMELALAEELADAKAEVERLTKDLEAAVRAPSYVGPQPRSSQRRHLGRGRTFTSSVAKR